MASKLRQSEVLSDVGRNFDEWQVHQMNSVIKLSGQASYSLINLEPSNVNLFRQAWCQRLPAIAVASSLVSIWWWCLGLIIPPKHLCILPEEQWTICFNEPLLPMVRGARDGFIEWEIRGCTHYEI
jgi:hypothetical protein